MENQMVFCESRILLVRATINQKHDLCTNLASSFLTRPCGSRTLVLLHGVVTVTRMQTFPKEGITRRGVHECRSRREESRQE